MDQQQLKDKILNDVVLELPDVDRKLTERLVEAALKAAYSGKDDESIADALKNVFDGQVAVALTKLTEAKTLDTKE